jgi:hypothetical protein
MLTSCHARPEDRHKKYLYPERELYYKLKDFSRKTGPQTAKLRKNLYFPKEKTKRCAVVPNDVKYIRANRADTGKDGSRRGKKADTLYRCPLLQ